jgi:hypothetical protein
VADEWAWPPLAVGDTSCGLGVEDDEALITLRMITGVGLEQLLRFPLRYK